MSRGPGRIERAIRELFDAYPDLAFVTDELCEHCYPDVRPIERKHQVAVLRAAHKVVASDPDWGARRIEGQGRGCVFVNHANVKSYALAHLIGNEFNIYRSEKRARRAWGFKDFPLLNGDRVRPGAQGIKEITKGGLRFARVWGDYDHLICDRAQLQAQLESNTRYRTWMAPDGPWDRHVQEHCARRDGNTELADRLELRRKYEFAKWAGVFSRKRRAEAEELGKCIAAVDGSGKETLKSADPATLAAKARALMGENDPDGDLAGGKGGADLPGFHALPSGLAGRLRRPARSCRRG